MNTTEHPLILFDGVCNYCNAMVNFVIRQDRKAYFRFAPLQSDAGLNTLARHHLSQQDFDSFILVENGQVYKKSKAALRVAARLGLVWKWSQIFWLVPNFLRDGIYDIIARNRYKWFGKKDACMIPSPEVKERFILD